MPAAGIGHGELVRGWNFGEPSVHAERVFLQAVLRRAGSLADPLDTVYFVHDSLRDQSEVGKMVEE